MLFFDIMRVNNANMLLAKNINDSDSDSDFDFLSNFTASYPQ